MFFFYCLRRIGQAIIVIVLVSMITFFLTRVVLGDPAEAILGGPDSTATPQQINELRHQLGLDKPIPVQYITWAGQLLTGHLGRSFSRPVTVASELNTAWPVTLELTFLAILISVVVGVALGVWSAVRPGTVIDAVASGASVVMLSIPNFVLGILFVLLFSLVFKLLPSGGYQPLSAGIVPNLRFMILPSITLATAYVGSFARFTRSVMLRILGEQYVQRAVASGLPGRAVVGRHALRVATVPLMTVVGLNVAGLVGGAVVTEQIFSLPGLGTLLTTAVLSKDLQTVEGAVLVVTGGVVAVNLIVDLLYGLMDPRVRTA